MLNLHLQRVLFFARTISSSPKIQIIQPGTLTTNQSPIAPSQKSKYKQDGPQLQITKILIKNGPLTSRQIWRSYHLELQSNTDGTAHRYFNSLSHLKKTLGFMRDNMKIKGNGYDKKKKLFKGWKIDEKRALKYVHPDIVAQLELFKKEKNQL